MQLNPLVIPARWTLLASLSVACSVAPTAGQPPASQPRAELFGRNLDFETGDDGGMPADWSGGRDGYEIRLTSTHPHGGKRCARIGSVKEVPATGFCAMMQRLSLEPLRGKRVRYCGWLRTEKVDSGHAGLLMRVDGPDHNVLAFDNMGTRPVKGTADWARYEIVLDVAKEATAVIIGAMLAGDGRLYIDDLRIEIVGADTPVTAMDIAKFAQARSAAPGLFELRGEYRIDYVSGAGPDGDGESENRDAKILFPVPLSYREQVPITYSLTASPPSRLRSARLYEDKPGNWVLEATVVRAPRETFEMKWHSIVLCGPRSFDDVPKHASLPERWPADVTAWLRSTRCVESDDQRIKDVAKQIRSGKSDVMEIIQATLERTGTILKNQKGRCAELGAVEALEKSGSCTSCANLMAALLRANGIPARIMACYPAWSGPLQTHYIVEAYVPGYGWYPIESTRLLAPVSPCEQIEVAIIPPEYEDRSERRQSAAGGVPYLSMTECPDVDSIVLLGTVDEKEKCDHVAKQFKAFPRDATSSAWTEALDGARRRWSSWLASAPKASGKTGLSTPLTPEDLKDIGDPGGLARRLDRS